MRGRLALLCLGGLLSLALVELAARSLWTAPWTERLSQAQQASGEHAYLLNDWGLRDREYGARAGGQRLLILGDSFTFGQGVEDDAQVFPAILERRLPGVEVLNGGLPGTLTGAWVKLWRRIGPEFDPDAVLAVFFLRDGTAMRSQRDYFFRIRDEIAERNRESRAYRWLYIVRLLRDRADRARIGSYYSSLFRDAYLGDESQTAEWVRAQRNLLRLRDLVAEHGARFGLAVFPMLVELDEDYPFADVVGVITAFAAQHQIPVHDLLPAFLGESGPELWVSPADQHPNARAHEIAADSLLPFARRLLGD